VLRVVLDMYGRRWVSRFVGALERASFLGFSRSVPTKFELNS